MNETLGYSFLVDAGVDLFYKHEISRIHREYKFSEDYYRYLLGSSHQQLDTALEQGVLYALRSDAGLPTLVELNEDSIVSAFIFIIGKWSEDYLLGEVLCGKEQGAIVLLAEKSYGDIDSLEELLEDLSIDVDKVLHDDVQVLATLLSSEFGVATIIENSFSDFMDNRLLRA